MCMKKMFANAIVKALYKDESNNNIKIILANHSIGDVVNQLIQSWEDNKLGEFLKTLGFEPKKPKLFENFVIEKDNKDNLDTEVSMNITYKDLQFHIGVFINDNDWQVTVMPYDNASYLRYKDNQLEYFGMVDNYSEVLMRFMLPSSAFERAAQYV